MPLQAWDSSLAVPNGNQTLTGRACKGSFFSGLLMPYKNIHFIKVKMELLEDHRFLFQLSDSQKGLYLMLLALAGKTNNKIFNDLVFIKGRLNLKDITIKDLETISEIFPKFRLDKDFWIFDNFNEEHNQIFTKDYGISQGYPKDIQRMDKNRIDKNRIDKKDRNNDFTPPTEEEAIAYFTEKLKSTKDKALEFYRFYGCKGWLVGKSPMRNWHMAAARSMKWGEEPTKKDPYANLPNQNF